MASKKTSVAAGKPKPTKPKPTDTRIQLAKAFPKWHEQKEIFDELFRQQNVNKAHAPHVVVMNPSEVLQLHGQKVLQAKVHASEFMTHLLDLHARTCSMCNNR